MAYAPPIPQAANRLKGFLAQALLALVPLAMLGIAALLSTSCFSAAAALKPGTIKRLGWTVSFQPTSGAITDGTVFYNAKYRGVPVFKDMRVPFSYVDYTHRLPPFRDILDQLGALNFDRKTPSFRGCTGTRVRREDGVAGFLVNCHYYFDVPSWEWVETPPEEKNPHCALYRYEQRLYLYADGSFRPEVITWGPGYDNPHTYLIPIRIDVGVGKNGDRGDRGFVRGTNRWLQVMKEQLARGVRRDAEGYAWLVRGGPAEDGPALRIKPGTDDHGILWFLRRRPSDRMDGAKRINTPAEYARPAESLARGQNIYTWYRGSVFNSGCYTIPLAVGPEIISTSGY